MTERKSQSTKEECLQSLILKQKQVIFGSLTVVALYLLFWYLLVYNQIVFPIFQGDYEIVDLVSLGLQRQLFWGVVALSSFIGYYQFLVVVNRRKSFSWLFKLIFGGFVLVQTVSITRTADTIRWIAGLEEQGRMPIESPTLHGFVSSWLPLIVLVVCSIVWLVYLCLFIEKTTKDVKG